jgi:hypothetical protein
MIVGTSIDHRILRHSQSLFGEDAVRIVDFAPKSGHYFESCTIPEFNFSIAYTIERGSSTLSSSRNISGEMERFKTIDQVIRENGWTQGPHFLCLSGIEWDFKNWKDAHISMNTSLIGPFILLQLDIAKKVWPLIEVTVYRNVYNAPKYIHNKTAVQIYNNIVTNTLNRSREL